MRAVAGYLLDALAMVLIVGGFLFFALSLAGAVRLP